MPEQAKTVFSLELVNASIHTLPLLHSVAAQLKQRSHESTDFYPKVAELASEDPLLSARIISAAHSVPCGPLKPVYSIEKALERIGVFNTLALINQLTQVDTEMMTPGYKIGWRHSIEVAVFSRFLANHTTAFNVNADLAYMAGLLHDIGRFILLQMVLNTGQQNEARSWNALDELPETEIQQYGFTHTEVGYMAAQRWNLPRTLTNVLRFHQHYDLWDFKTVSLPFKQLMTVVQFADFLSMLLIKNPEWPAWSSTQLKGFIAEHCIHEDWPKIDFPIEYLAEQLPMLSEQCQRLVINAEKTPDEGL
ncbi:HDOD domain-containing protein [Amphritea opalescens]|uniref:HDOD domain-containing protein n=1 Tax=Amphritea opalescens TaxID=2490544 RepID=UPI0013DF73F2|nr:HDOD domain-containing protein [Amphritea opalescens]